MNTKTQELVTAGYELAKGLDAESAALVKQLADELAVQRVRADELNKQVVNLAVENAGAKAARDIIRHLNANREEARFCGIDDDYIDAAVEAMKTPDTDAVIANWQAKGVENLLSIEPSELLEKMPAFRQMTVSEENVRDVLNSIRLTLKLRKGAAV